MFAVPVASCSGDVYRVVLRGQGTLCACKVFDFEQRHSLPEHFIQVRRSAGQHILVMYLCRLAG